MGKKLCIIFLLLLQFTSQKVFASENTSWVDQFDNFRFAVDFSLRPRYEFEQGDYSRIESVGIDIHKVFSASDGGDLGTLVLQGYFTKLNSVKKHPSFFDDENDSKFICRICNFNMTIMDRGKLNLRIGHAEIPFGLEYNQDSNGTLRQYSNGRDLGNKLDWGVAAMVNYLGVVTKSHSAEALALTGKMILNLISWPVELSELMVTHHM